MGEQTPTEDWTPDPATISRKAAANATAISAMSQSISSRTTEQNDLDWYWAIYVRHPWVRLCVNLISDAVAAEGFSVVPVDGNEKTKAGQYEARTAKIVQFLRNAFVGTTFTRALLTLSVDLNVHNVGYWIKKRFLGVHIGFERIDPRTVSPILSPDKKSITSYKIGRVNTGLVGDDTGVMVSANDMLRFTVGGGDVLFGTPSVIEALDLTITIDWRIRHHREAFFRNGAVAGRVLVNKEGNEDDVKAALAMVRNTNTGSENAYKTVVLTGDWEVSEKAQSGSNDVDFVKGTQISRDEIFAAFKIPIGKVFADSKGALGQAGKTVDDDTFQRDAVLPIETAIYEGITLGWLHKELGWTDIELVPKRLNQIRLDRFSAAADVVKFGGTGNEARAIAGLPPIDDERMNVPLFLGQHQPIPDEEIGDEDDPTEEETEDDSTEPPENGDPQKKPKLKTPVATPKKTTKVTPSKVNETKNTPKPGAKT